MTLRIGQFLLKSFEGLRSAGEMEDKMGFLGGFVSIAR